jgi:hypothetical protein
MNSKNRSNYLSLVNRNHTLAVTLALVLVPHASFAQTQPAKTAEANAPAPETPPTAPISPNAVAAPTAPAPAASVDAEPIQPAPAVKDGQAAVPPMAASASPNTPVSGASTPSAEPPTEVSKQAAEAEALEAALAARDAATDVSPDEAKISAYGFADFSYSRRFDNRKTNFVGNRLPSFYVGNFNVYLGGDLGGRWRALSEVRLTYLPDGVINYNNYDATTNQFQRTSTAYPDYADYYRNRKVGGVIIERVWVEYAAHPLLTIRAGQWLTPYGIWNVDHGSPVVIGVTRPYIVGNEWFPSHQTGLEFYGSHGIGDSSFGYHLTVSNGRGPVDAYEDLDKNKAIGWRLWAKHDSSIGAFTLGASGYHGRYTDLATGLKTDNSGLQNTTVSSYKELALAADFKWTLGGFLFQTEAIFHDVAYNDKARPAITFPAPGWSPDSREWGLYAITGYRLSWLGVMPFVGTQYLDVGKYNSLTCWELNGGLNIRPTDRIVLKVVGLWVWRPEPIVASKSEGQFLSQIAWSF